MLEDTYATLEEKGYNVQCGTLGTPYKVDKSSAMLPVSYCGSLPNYTEQEIIIIDFHIDEDKFLDMSPSEDNIRPHDEDQFWAKCSNGYFDPRPIASELIRENFNRILKTNGIFIVFADEPIKTHFEYGYVRDNGFRSKKYTGTTASITIWSLLNELQYIQPQRVHGNELSLCENIGLEKHPFYRPLRKLLQLHLDGAKYYCTFNDTSQWLPLLHNKYNECVGMMTGPNNGGFVFVLPQLKDKTNFILAMLSDILPEVVSTLFPDYEKAKWIYWPAYELPQVISLQEKKQKIQETTEKQILELDAEIEKERIEHNWLHQLLTGTDSQLVTAVKSALEFLGFEQVIDEDEERDKKGESRREDLQIKEKDCHILILDVKGINGTPKDDDVLQANKHADLRRMEWDDATVRGLSIINHERHIPPLDRNTHFRQELLDLAKGQQFGLLTTWALYRFVKNRMKNTWSYEYIKPLFYQHGRIEVIPQHYEPLGKIAHVFPEAGAFGLDLQDSLEIDDRIAVQFPIEFEEITIESLRINNVSVEKANSGDPVGTTWPPEKPLLKEGLHVFKVKNTSNDKG